MKYFTIIIFTTFLAIPSFAQVFYRGLERMCWTNDKGKLECYDAPRKWYHLNTVLIDEDSIFIYKSPVRVEKNDTVYSASDGAFYYYFGVIRQADSLQLAYLTSHNCDYCGTRVRIDSLTGFRVPIPRLDTLKVIKNNKGLTIGKTAYQLFEPGKEFYFPDRRSFYFDSNSISRTDPKGQYKLISQAIKNFLQTKELTLDNDTLSVCLDRYDFINQNKLIETLVADSFHIDTTKIVFQFLSRQQLRAKSNNEQKVLRYISINRIIDYWKAARIQLSYKILVPKTVHIFSEKQYSNSFEYYKEGGKYVLTEEISENNWELIEQK